MQLFNKVQYSLFFSYRNDSWYKGIHEEENRDDFDAEHVESVCDPRSSGCVRFTPRKIALKLRGKVAQLAYKATKSEITRFFGAVGRNEPCPCGSGVKYKKCHGA
ncbi:TPA: SEC-C domain-containing protein [Klebsiella variicola]|nr:SEC-C domain-containing protein [Klebsiella variicola]